MTPEQAIKYHLANVARLQRTCPPGMRVAYLPYDHTNGHVLGYVPTGPPSKENLETPYKMVITITNPKVVQSTIAAATESLKSIGGVKSDL